MKSLAFYSFLGPSGPCYINMKRNQKVKQAEEMLKELEEPYTISDLVGGYVTIALGCMAIPDKVIEGISK